MNCLPLIRPLRLLACLFALGACSGGGGSASNGGIGGTGAIAKGEIDGFGSIFVNGIKYNTDSANIFIDDETSLESNLRLGMMVLVKGEINEDGLSGTADTVYYEDEITGPISSLMLNTDGNEILLDVLDVTIVANKVDTVFENVSFDTLSINDVIEVSGVPNSAGEIIASRIQKIENFISGTSEINIKGRVTNLLASTFSLGSLTVDFSAADLSKVSNSTLTESMQVKVKGTLSGTTITADRIKEQNNPLNDANNEDIKVSIESIITNYISISNFMLDGITVDASNASLEPSTLILADGIRIEAEGMIIDGILVASEIKAENGGIKLHANVATVSPSENNITLQFASGDRITAIVDNRSRLVDGRGGQNTLSLSDISAGEFVEIKALLGDGDNIIIKKLNRYDESDDEIIQGPVENFTANSSITILGITYLVDNTAGGTTFEDINDIEIDTNTFFSGLTTGVFIQIKDNEMADGTADKIEYEN
ncbi:MAG: DUF5666 domain-containing protein [Cellvibrionaceae bacterium]